LRIADKRNMLPLLVLWIVLQSSPGCQTSRSGAGWAEYPENAAPSVSPNRRYQVENDGTYATDARRLRLVNRRTAERTELLEYYRNAFVKWSPSSDKLLVNIDGSSEMTPWIFNLDSGARTDLREKFEASVFYDDAIENSVHWYAKGTEWRGDYRIRVNVSGHGSGYDFSKWYVYDLLKETFAPD